MSSLLAALYVFCILALAGFAAFILAKARHNSLNRHFAALSISLLGWVGTLFALNFIVSPAALLTTGRANFASVAIASTLAYLFVGELSERRRIGARWMWVETVTLTLCTLFLPAVDRAELVRNGQHVSVYGPLFAVYMLHVIVYLSGAVATAFRPPRPASSEVRDQLRLIGWGILATTSIALVSNALVPYWIGDFRWIHVGTLSTILFLMTVGAAVFSHHLFDIHVVVRATFVYAGLITLALEIYRLALDFLARLLPLGSASERAFAATALALAINAFSQEPVRRWLERTIDRLVRRKHRMH
jgi:hypothetical protein